LETTISYYSRAILQKRGKNTVSITTVGTTGYNSIALFLIFLYVSCLFLAGNIIIVAYAHLLISMQQFGGGEVFLILLTLLIVSPALLPILAVRASRNAANEIERQVVELSKAVGAAETKQAPIE